MFSLFSLPQTLRTLKPIDESLSRLMAARFGFHFSFQAPSKVDLHVIFKIITILIRNWITRCVGGKSAGGWRAVGLLVF